MGDDDRNLSIPYEVVVRLRWDHDQELLTADGRSICSLCSKPIPEEDVPLRLWANDGVDMATVGGCCFAELFNVKGDAP